MYQVCESEKTAQKVSQSGMIHNAQLNQRVEKTAQQNWAIAQNNMLSEQGKQQAEASQVHTALISQAALGDQQCIKADGDRQSLQHQSATQEQKLHYQSVANKLKAAEGRKKLQYQSAVNEQKRK
jgi:hypothetical protein